MFQKIIHKLAYVSMLVLVGIVFVLGFAIGQDYEREWWNKRVDIIPTPEAIQTFLVQEGYDIKIDSVIGPETMKAWNDWLITEDVKRMIEE